MPSPPSIDLDIRSYGPDQGPDRHDFAQLVLPIAGSLTIDVAGREGRLDPAQAAFVDAGALHSQTSTLPNRSLILDLDPAGLDRDIAERLARRPFLPLLPATGRLIDYMAMMLRGGTASASIVARWVPLLLDTLTLAAPGPRSRLQALLATVERQPGLPWSAAAMAEQAGLSVSRLHVLFRQELNSTPRGWLSELRLRHVREGLADGSLPIAELAYRNGYADQSALTRAMRRATGLTPAAYRRELRDARESGPGKR